MNKNFLNVQKGLICDYWSIIHMIPVFIASTNLVHKKCMDISIEIFNEISMLLDTDVLPIKAVERIERYVTDKLALMDDLDQTVTMLYYGYIREMIVYYRDMAISEELYETGENLVKFLRLFDSDDELEF